MTTQINSPFQSAYNNKANIFISIYLSSSSYFPFCSTTGRRRKEFCQTSTVTIIKCVCGKLLSYFINDVENNASPKEKAFSRMLIHPDHTLPMALVILIQKLRSHYQAYSKNSVPRNTDCSLRCLVRLIFVRKYILDKAILRK